MLAGLGRAFAPAAFLLALASRVAWRVVPAFALAFGLAFVGAAVTAGTAEAQEKSIAVYIEGPDADNVRADVVAAVPKTLRVIEPGEYSGALRKAGLKPPMGNVIAQPKFRDKVLTKVRKATEQVGAAAAIIGRVRKTRTGSREVWLLFVDAIPGDLSVDEAVAITDDSDARKSAFKSVLDKPLREIAPEEKKASGGEASAGGDAATPEEGEEKKDEDEPEEATWRTPNDVGQALFIVGVNYQAAGRFFGYSDGLSANLRPYDVFGAPMLHVFAEVYPAGFFGNVPVAKDIGLTFSYARAFGLDSATANGEPIGTSYTRLNAGLRGRLRLGDEAPTGVLGLNAGISMLDFAFDAPGMLDAEVPEVSYMLLRFGLDGRFPAGPVALEIGGDFLLPLSSGQVYDRFRDPSVLGVEGRAGVAVPIAAGFEARVHGEYTRFFSSFAPVPGDPYVAGGALDQLLALRVGAAYAY